MLQLRLCPLHESEQMEEDYQECFQLLQEMLSLQQFNVFDPIAHTEILEAVSVFNEKLLQTESLLGLAALAEEQPDQARRRLNRELAKIKAYLEELIWKQQFKFKYFEYGCASLQHKAAGEGNFRETDFNKLLLDVDRFNEEGLVFQSRAKVAILISRLKTCANASQPEPLLLKKTKSDLLSAWRSMSRETLMRLKKKFYFWKEEVQDFDELHQFAI